MITRHQPFAEQPVYYLDADGLLVTNQRGDPATDGDVNQFFRAVGPDLDRLTLEMCAYHRSRGEALEQWQLDAELAAFKRTRMRGKNCA